MVTFNLGDRVVVAVDNPYYRYDGRQESTSDYTHGVKRGSAGRVVEGPDGDGDYLVQFDVLGRVAVAPECLAHENRSDTTSASRVSVADITRTVVEKQVALQVTLTEAAELLYAIEGYCEELDPLAEDLRDSLIAAGFGSLRPPRIEKKENV